MKKGKGKEDEGFKNPKIDIVILQWANTALGNRLDNMKRSLESYTLTERTCLAVAESYEYFFVQFFAGWKNFLVKLERINMLVKKQDNSERQTQKFKQLFDSMGEMVQVVSKFKEVMDIAANEYHQQIGQQSRSVDANSFNAITFNPISTNILNGQNGSSYSQNSSAVSGIKKNSITTSLIELQKLTKSRVEGFLKLFENIYTEVSIDCATYGQRMSEAVKQIYSSNDTHDTMRKLYKENNQLQSKLKEFEQFVEKPVPLGESEKDFIQLHFNGQNKIIKDLQQQLQKEKELVDQLSLRVRHKMDYSLSSIQAKIGKSNQAHKDTNAKLENESVTKNDEKIEIEENGINDPNKENNKIPFHQIEQEEVQGFECVCGGYQAEYFSQKLEEAAKKIADTKLDLLKLSSQQAITGPLIQPESNVTNKSSQESLSKVASEKKEDHNSGLLAILATSVQSAGVLSAPLGARFVPPEDEAFDIKLKVTYGEKIAMLNKQKEQMLVESTQQEKVIRELEMEGKNIEEKFFSSGVYTSLSVQCEELFKTVTQLKSQLIQAKGIIVDVERIRFKETSELIQNFKEEKESLLKQLKDAKNGVFKENLAKAIKDNLDTHFNYKKYTQPLQEQLTEMSESLQNQRDLAKSLEDQKIQFQKNAQEYQKQIHILQSSLHQKDSKILMYEANNTSIKSSFVDDKIFKNSKTKDTLKGIENILIDLIGTTTRSGILISEEIVKNFRETVGYFKQREEKVSLYEQKYKQSEQEKEKLVSIQEQQWKDYDSLNNAFTHQKKASDHQKTQLEVKMDKEQELESKNLEIMMKLQQEQHSHKILLVAEQQKLEKTKQVVDSVNEQNKSLLAQNQEAQILIKEQKALFQSLKSELEQQNIVNVDLQQKYSLNSKKLNEIQQQYSELISDHERVKLKLQDAYDVLENIDNKELKSKNLGGDTSKSAEQEKIRNLTTLLQCQCGERIKDVILQKCLHPFCRNCIDKQVKTRSRACPKCRTPFGTNDIKTLYLSN